MCGASLTPLQAVVPGTSFCSLRSRFSHAPGTPSTASRRRDRVSFVLMTKRVSSWFPKSRRGARMKGSDKREASMRLELDLERVRASVGESATEDLLDDATVYREGMEPAALD